ncbi:hypothetical protein ACP70R_019786 [Stipagrostis hirtigluma subsp. patula]
MTRRRLLSSAPPATLPPLEDDDLLSFILHRLPPLPSTLPRASLVCKRWRRIVSDPSFLRGFRAHHRKPPLLGLFHSDAQDAGYIRFIPALDPPDRIPAARFPLWVENQRRCRIIGIRHGRVLFIDRKRRRFLVWEPLAGGRHSVPFPPPPDGMAGGMKKNGAILCAASDQGHVHGSCHSAPFQVISLSCSRKLISACVYSSETNGWGNAISLPWPPNTASCCSSTTDWPNTMVGNSICWMLMGRTAAILLFDLDRKNLCVVEVPPDAYDRNAVDNYGCQLLITPADNGGLGLLVLSGGDYTVRVWKRKSERHGVSGWMLQNTVELNSHLLSLMRPGFNTLPLVILGFAEEDNAMFLRTPGGATFMIHLDSAEFKKLPESMHYGCCCHPFKSFYTAGM